jgi:hypothetical protein
MVNLGSEELSLLFNERGLKMPKDKTGQGDYLIDQDDMCDDISEKFSIDAELVSLVLDAEMAYFESKGLVTEEKNFEENSPNQRPILEIQAKELMAYVETHTGLAPDVISKILNAEKEYIDKHK